MSDEAIEASFELINAATNGDLDTVTKILDTGIADIDCLCDIPLRGVPLRGTASHAAIGGNHYSVLKLLIERGANLAVSNDRGESLLTTALSQRHEPMAHLLLDAGAPFADFNNSLAITSIAHASTAILTRLLFTSNIDLSTLRDRNGGTIIHVATTPVSLRKDVSERLRFLVRVAGVDIDSVDHRG